jgi:hypothetical protein
MRLFGVLSLLLVDYHWFVGLDWPLQFGCGEYLDPGNKKLFCLCRLWWWLFILMAR